MSSICVDLSMSIDGFIAGPGVGIDRPMGDGGERLHEWMFAGKSSEESRAVEEERFASTGALIMGRTMLELGVGHGAGTRCFTHRCSSSHIGLPSRS
jgi:hypothetical protein